MSNGDIVGTDMSVREFRLRNAEWGIGSSTGGTASRFLSGLLLTGLRERELRKGVLK